MEKEDNPEYKLKQQSKAKEAKDSVESKNSFDQMLSRYHNSKHSSFRKD